MQAGECECLLSPEDRNLLNRLAEALGAMSSNVGQLMFRNAVLTAACGALYAELARVSGEPGDIDAMLGRLTGVIEARPDNGGHVLHATDELRNAAEALGAEFGLK